MSNWRPGPIGTYINIDKAKEYMDEKNKTKQTKLKLTVTCIHCKKNINIEDTGYRLFGLCSYCNKAALLPSDDKEYHI